MYLRPRIDTKTFTDELYYKNTLMLDIKIEYPEITGPISLRSELILHKYYMNDLRKIYRYAKLELYPMAVDSYKYAVSQGFPFNAYTLIREMNVTFNDKGLISLYFDTYEYTGGAHGLTTRVGNTWSLDAPKLLTLDDLFAPGFDYADVIIREITRQAHENIKAGNDIYFDNVEANIVSNFNPANFYLTPDGVAIFYPLYSIAPYAAGIQVFVIPYDMLDFRVNKW